MKILRIIVCAALLAASLSCNDNPDNRAGSTPIDSSNLHGTAGAVYGADDPAEPRPPRYEGQFDTGMQPNTMSGEDSMNQYGK